ncbi:MAG: 50S ribosomal protein L25 [Saprospiraceae bacterium]|nr:50S ribosomal protein L25 [Saprospiraceae bacterium]MCB9329155.1 50S ribosomal protein L25 [Lewinellaceae bacterium]
MQKVSIEANKRTDLGSASAKRIRQAGDVPAVIYGGNDVVHCSVPAKQLKNLVYTPDLKLAEVSVDGTNQRCILKDIQFHPVTDEIVHIDFLRIMDKTPIKVNVPLKFKGVSPGVKAGGKLVQSMRTVIVKTTPEKLTDELFLDISKLDLGQSIRVRDIEVPEGVEIMVNSAIPVAVIEIPRALKSAAAAEAKAAGGKKK